jgi:hypothetical protein
MAYRAGIVYRTTAVVHLVLGVLVTIVLAVTQWEGLSAFVALAFLPVFAGIVLVGAGRVAPSAPSPGLRLASERASRRRALLVNGASAVVYAAVLAFSLVLGDGGWILPAIVLGNGLAQAQLARRVAAAEAVDPRTLQATVLAWRAQRGLVLWRREWGDVAP